MSRTKKIAPQPPSTKATGDKAVSIQVEPDPVSVSKLDTKTSSITDNCHETIQSYEEELDWVSNSLAAAGSRIEEEARSLLLRADALLTSRSCGTSPSLSRNVVEDLRKQAESLADRSLQLHEQTAADANKLRRIVALADQSIDGLGAMVDRRFEIEPWASLSHCGRGTLIVLLSDAHVAIRDLEASLTSQTPGDDKNQKWVAPESFKRKTTKYWVKEEHLYEVLLASVSELPLLVYGQAGGRILDQGEACNEVSDIVGQDVSSSYGGSYSSLWTSGLATPINSVYFDSPSMDMYAERLKRAEGAKLFRIRWYGPNKPRGDEIVYLELKTHHECWIGDPSVKERVAIREEDVSRLLDFEDEDWNEQRAYQMVCKAKPTKDPKSITRQSKLLLQMRALVCKFNLKPCVRTKYTRVALQAACTNQFRLTIDKDIMVVNERGRDATASSSSWCFEDDESIPKKDVAKIPYCVYEVKIADSASGMPAFISGLEDSMVITEAKKFSKFLCGASIFNANKVATLPWWADDVAFVPLYQEKLDTVSDPKATDDDGDAAVSVTGSNSSSGTIGSGYNDFVSFLSGSTSQASFTPPSSLHSDVELTRKEDAAADTELRDETISSRQSDNLFWSLRRSMSLPQISLHKKKESSLFNKSIASKTRLRVEPKSHFANERTFIQWISAALLFITFSQLLFIFAAQSDEKEPVIAGKWMLAMSLFIAVYAIAIYYRRVYLMTHGRPYGYTDFLGPGILTASIISGVSLLIVYMDNAHEPTHQVERPSSEGTVFTMVHQAGHCIRRSMEGAPGESRISLLMELQPSGVLIDETKGLLLVPSLNHIIALKDGLPTEEENAEPVKVVSTLDKSDIEALEYVEDTIFALSEAGKGSDIIALQWMNESIQNSSGPVSPHLFPPLLPELRHASNISGDHCSGKPEKQCINDGCHFDESTTLCLIASSSASGEHVSKENSTEQLRTIGENSSCFLAGSIDGCSLQEVHRWKLSLSGPEGLALLPGKDFESLAKLIIAQNSIEVFDLDDFHFAVDKVKKKSMINKRMVSRGLPTAKIGSMQYFEGLLYMLFDNSHVIRAFNITTGEIVLETSLPVAEIGSENQWEGMRLQRIKDSDIVNRGLRGSNVPGTVLVLHLALDTPAQVWSIRLEEGREKGQLWTFPGCATGTNHNDTTEED